MFENRGLETALIGRIQIEVPLVLSVYTVERKNTETKISVSLNFHKISTKSHVLTSLVRCRFKNNH